MSDRSARSRLVNEALHKELLLRRRRAAVKELLRLRAGGAPVSAEEIATAVRRDRRRP